MSAANGCEQYQHLCVRARACVHTRTHTHTHIVRAGLSGTG